MITANKCALCSKRDVLQNYDFSKQIQTSFFSVNKKQFPEDFVKDIKLCVICAQKIQLSTCIKKDYDEMCNRNNRISNLKCFFCEQKTYLSDLDDNPNQVHRKIDMFLNAVIIRHEWKQFKACLKCLYNLDIWFDVRNKLYTITNIPTTVAEDELKHNNNNRSLSQQRSPRKVHSKLNLEKQSITNSKRNKPRPRRRQNNKQKIQWNNYLNERLNKFRTVDRLLDNETMRVVITERNITDQDKLFNKLPFVEVLLNSQINTRKEDVIIISDTETEQVRPKRSTRKRRLNLSLKSLFSPRSNEGSPIQTRGVRSSSSTSKNKRKPSPKENDNDSIDSNSESPTERKSPAKDDFNDKNSIESNSESSIEVIDSSSDEQENFVCNVCDKCFTVKCDYLQHCLNHEKLQKLVVKVPRQKLPPKLNVSELTNDQSLSTSVNITALLSKWAGESAAQEYQECSKKYISTIDDTNNTTIDEGSEENKEDEVVEDINSDMLEDKSGENQSDEETEPIVNEKEKNVDDTEEISDEGDRDDAIECEDKNDTVTKSCKDINDTVAKSCEDKNDTVTKSSKDVQDKTEEAAIVTDQEENDEGKEKEDDGIEKDSDEEEKEKEEEEVDAKEKEEEEVDEKEKEEEVDEKEREEEEDEKEKEEEEEEEEDEQDKPDEEVNKEKEVETDVDEDKSSQEQDEEPQKSENKNRNGITESETDLDKVDTTKKNGKNIGDDSKKTKSGEDTEEFTNESSEQDPEMSCEDLLNILDDDETKSRNGSNKRKHEDNDEEVTPKRKRVRFAEEKEIYTPDQAVTLERITINDQFSQEETDKNGESET